jgi:CBS domain-containing protein
MTTYPIDHLRTPNGFPKPEGLVYLESASAQPQIPAKVKVEEMSEQANVAAPATARDIMRPPLTTVEQNDHVAAAAYLMKHAGTTALMVMNPGPASRRASLPRQTSLTRSPTGRT